MRHTVLLALLLLLASPSFGAGDLVQEKVTDTPDGAVWAMRWSYGNTWTGPLPLAARSEKGAEGHLRKAVLELCRSEGHGSYRYATFSDIHAPDADPLLKTAWDHFGGSTQQSDGIRKTSFELVFFQSERIPTDRVSSSTDWRGCWTPQQLKAEERRQKLEEKRRKRLEKAIEKQKKAQQ